MGSFSTPPATATTIQGIKLLKACTYDYCQLLYVCAVGEKDVSIPLAYYLSRDMDGLKCTFLKSVS